jgi:hypothetical protein
MIMNRSISQPYAVGIACLLSLAVYGCDKTSGNPSRASHGIDGGTGSATITYRPDTRIMTATEGRALILGVSTNTAAFLLDGTNPAAKAFKVGDVWLVKDLFARRIFGLETQPDGEILVLTEPAGLTDIVSDAKIAVRQPVRFTTGPASRAQLLHRLGDVLVPVAYAQEAHQLAKSEQQGIGDKALSSLSDALFDGWKVTTNPSFANDKYIIGMALTREVAGLRGVITLKGTLDGFDFDGAIDVEQGKMVRIQSDLSKLNGVLNVTWEVATETLDAPTGAHRIKLPAGVQIPLAEFVGGLPLFLEISSAMIITPAMTGGHQYTKGAFRVLYNGSQNFTLKEGVVDSDGNVTGEISYTGGQNISALAPFGMVMAFAAPRVELSLGFSKVLKFDGIKEAAQKVDQLAEEFAKRLLTPEQYAAWQASPLSSIKLSSAVSNAMKSDAAAYFEVVTSSGMSHSGASVIIPCTRNELAISAFVGGSVEAFAMPVARTYKTVFEKKVVHIDPPGVKLCRLD